MTATRLQERVFIVSNAELRQEARDHVARAIDLIGEVELNGLERVLVDTYLIPQLTHIISVLDLETDAVAEILAARRELETATSILGKVRDAVAALRLPVLHETLGNVIFKLIEVTLRLPPV